MLEIRPHILIIDDEAGIRQSLTAFLERAGFEISSAGDGQAGLVLHARHPADLIVLDVLMPRMDGREMLRALRRQGDWTPVILLTQVGEASERAMALEEGADDYLNKPFEAHELTARIRAVLRRASPGVPPLSAAWVLTAAGESPGPQLRLDRQARKATLDNAELALTPKALLLLEYLMTHPGESVSRERLLEAVWGWERSVVSRAVDARIAELRRVLEDDAAQPRFIDTLASQGYRFLGRVERGSQEPPAAARKPGSQGRV
jgi:DNA-binding response OmpR family regulator